MTRTTFQFVYMRLKLQIISAGWDAGGLALSLTTTGRNFHKKVKQMHANVPPMGCFPVADGTRAKESYNLCQSPQVLLHPPERSSNSFTTNARWYKKSGQLTGTTWYFENTPTCWDLKTDFPLYVERWNKLNLHHLMSSVYFPISSVKFYQKETQNAEINIFCLYHDW